MEHRMKPEWRTDTVIGICQQMRELQNFSAMPILADALQDAYCDNEMLLSDLRMGPSSYILDASIVAMILTDEAVHAVRWVHDFAGARSGKEYDGYNSRDWTYEDFMRAADNYLASGDYITGGSELEGEIVPDEFWDKYQIITGKPIPEDKRGNFFSCSC